MARNLPTLRDRLIDLELYAQSLEKLAVIDKLIAKVRATPDDVPVKVIDIAPVIVKRKFKGPPTFRQWATFLEKRTAMIIPDTGDITIPCLSCGIPLAISQSVVKLTRGSRGGKVREEKGSIVIGCVVKLYDEPDNSDRISEVLDSYHAGNLDAGVALAQIDELQEDGKPKYVPVHHRGSGCIDCQMKYLKIFAETERTYNQSQQQWFRGAKTTESPRKRIAFIPVEPRE
jgi:hypothetical protein